MTDTALRAYYGIHWWRHTNEVIRERGVEADCPYHPTVADYRAFLGELDRYTEPTAWFRDMCECDDCDCECLQTGDGIPLCWSCQRGDHEPHPLLTEGRSG